MTQPQPDFHHSAASTRTAFDIGHDFAFYRLPEPHTQSLDVLNGYANKKRQGGSTRRSTPSIRKWLNLRLHAYERKIHIDDNITPDFIDELFEKSNGICPITKDVMTVGTMTDTDWSVDRIINDYGYVRGNITIMSTRANAAKGCLSVDDIKAIRDTKATHDGLTHAQWSEMYTLVFFVARKLNELNTIKELNVREISADLLIQFVDKITDPFSPEDEAFMAMSTCISTHTPEKNLKPLRRTLYAISKRRKTEAPLHDLVRRSPRLLKEIMKLCRLVNWNGVANDIDTLRQNYVKEYDRVICAKRL